MRPYLSIPTIALIGLSFLGGCASKPKAPETFTFWPNPPAQPHVQFVTSYKDSADLKREQSSGLADVLMGKQIESSLGIGNPYGVAVWNGRIYVTDLKGRGVRVLDIKKRETRVMGATGAGEVDKAVDVAVADDGTKYVADLAKGQVVVFDANEKFVKTFVGELSPVGLAVDGDELYVADHEARVIKVLNRHTGQLLRTFGKDLFVRPLSVAIDPRGYVLVSDPIRCRVCRFTRDGKFVSSFGQHGARPGDFTRPKHMKVAKDGTIFIVDASFNNVQVFDEQGRIMGYFGLSGSHPGSMMLPAGLALMEDNLDLYADQIHPAFQAERLVVVTNQFGPNKVAIYAIGQLKPGHTMGEIATQRIEVTTGLEKENKSAPATRPTNSTTQPGAADPAGGKQVR